MNVVDTVTAMIEAYPSLYETRSDALWALVTMSWVEWKDGGLVFTHDAGIHHRENNFKVDETEPLYMQLFHSEQNALCQWRRENARKIAMCEDSKLSREDANTMWMPYERLAEMPDEVQDDWKDAMIEIAVVVKSITEPCEEKTHGYETHKKVIAFLAQHGRVNSDELDRRIARLTHELETLQAARSKMPS